MEHIVEAIVLVALIFVVIKALQLSELIPFDLSDNLWITQPLQLLLKKRTNAQNRISAPNGKTVGAFSFDKI